MGNDIVLECLVCEGYLEYGGKPCKFCNGEGAHYIYPDAVPEWEENAEKYMKLIDGGGDPEEWRG